MRAFGGPMSEFQYAPKVWAAFLNPRFCRRDEPHHFQAQASEPLTATWVRLAVALEDSRVQWRYNARACPATIAALEGFCADACDKPISELRFDARAWLSDLNVPTERLTRFLLIEDALQSIQALVRSSAGVRRD